MQEKIWHGILGSGISNMYFLFSIFYFLSNYIHALFALYPTNQTLGTSMNTSEKERNLFREEEEAQKKRAMAIAHLEKTGSGPSSHQNCMAKVCDLFQLHVHVCCCDCDK